MALYYNEVLRVESSSKPCQIIYTASGTATANQTPKAYILDIVSAINGASAANAQSIAYNSQFTDGTGFTITGNADVLVTLRNLGSAGAPLITLELKDINTISSDTFKAALTSYLATYYPAVSLTNCYIRSIIANYHE